MEMFRTKIVEIKEDDIQIGDKTNVIFAGGFTGKFDATVQLVTDEDILFMFDDCIIERTMNNEAWIKGRFEASDLNRWLQNVLLPAFPEELRSRITMLSIPSYGMMFGHDPLDDWHNRYVEPDTDKQLPLMKKLKNRIATFEDDLVQYWLRNVAPVKWGSVELYNCVNEFGYNALGINTGSDDDNYSGKAMFSCGVRPVFWINRY